MKKIRSLFLIVMLVALATGGAFAADDGPLFQRNLSKTPDTPTMGSQISVMPLYVPAQNTQGELVEIEYLAGDCTNQDPGGCEVVNTMTEAKPLVATFEDGIVPQEEEEGELSALTGTGFGQRDAFGALSLDDGATWKTVNLSNAADRSSFVLKDGHEYPGDVFRINHVVVGNRVAVAWISRYCESGSPLYSWEDDAKDALLAAYPELDHPVNVDGETEPYQMYTDDLFGVAGNQKSVDYTLQGFPEVGEIPYGCVWVARGTLEQDDDTGLYDITWRQAERLTSGRRDANRVDITGTGDAGFIISWQEDPEGLRPGKGLGPGEGWSGAIVNSKTDIWYTHIGWDHFDDVCNVVESGADAGDCEPVELADYTGEEKPKNAVPFAVPMRLTDNNACKADVAVDNQGYQPYCYADFDGNGTADLCADSISWTNPGGTTLNVCIAEDGRVLTGRTGSCRVRWALKPYTNPDGVTSAWVVYAAEKMKALGSELDEEEEPIDIGKNMWYYTFDMFNPELVAQGLMLNSPAIDYETGAMFPVQTDEWGNEFYETEIARRFNLMVQGVGAAMASPSKTSAILLYKEGILFQGGPADIFMRRVVLPADFDPAVDNPFAYENVVCDAFDIDGTGDVGDWLYADGSNPNYVRGLCAVQGVNMSGTTIVSCDDGSGGDTCADSFPWDADADDSGYPKVTEWIQTEENLDDPSWVNPYDVSKGHRGFIDGDFVMMMYATAPNWKANTTGNEAYNLYIRRSFDGGQTWTTLPASYTHIDGTTWTGDGTESCEWYGWGGQTEWEVCTTYGAGEFEQARNVSQLTGTKITVLDPRYTPTGGMLKTDYSSLLCYDDGLGDWTSCGYDEASAPYPEEIRDPSGFFVTYETGDNTVVTVDTATVPLDMYYSRAFNFGDDFDTVEFTTSSGQLVERWDWLENGPDLATEASVFADSNGSRFYAVWNQELEIGYEIYTDMDIQFRRIFYNFDSDAYPTASILYVSATEASYEEGGDITFTGTGRDNDRVGQGVVSVEWSSDIDGVLSTEKSFQIDVSLLSIGTHTITFVVEDGEGHRSNPASVTLRIAETIADLEPKTIYLPLIFR